MSVASPVKTAWTNRKHIGEKNHAAQLAKFLPAALEIQETPPHPLAKWVSRSLISLFLIGLLWASIGEVDVVTSAEGKIIPSNSVKTIQPLNKAIVKQILVREGESVAAGQPLVELDTTLTDADKNRLAKEIRNLNLSIALEQSLLTALSQQLDTDSDVIGKVELTLDRGLLSDDDLDSYQSLLEQKWQSFLTQHQAILSVLDKNNAQTGEIQQNILRLESTLPIIERRTAKVKELSEKGFISETEYLALEQERIQIQQDLEAEKYRLKQLSAQTEETKQNIASLISNFRTEQLTAITEQKRIRSGLDEELTKATNINDAQTLYAPVSGKVQELAIGTIGGVVTDAQILMVIVPSDGVLEAEVQLENKDIGFVEEGMEVEVKIHTFPFTKYGLIHGEVTNISNDAVLDENQNLNYKARILLSKHNIAVGDKLVNLIPGMSLTAEVKTGKRNIINFFLDPIQRQTSESLRER